MRFRGIHINFTHIDYNVVVTTVKLSNIINRFHVIFIIRHLKGRYYRY